MFSSLHKFSLLLVFFITTQSNRKSVSLDTHLAFILKLFFKLVFYVSIGKTVKISFYSQACLWMCGMFSVTALAENISKRFQQYCSIITRQGNS